MVTPTESGVLSPRLLDRRQAASYLGVSSDTIDRLRHAGALAVVAMPGARDRRTNRGTAAGVCRRVLFDRQDLDDLVERWKERD